MRRYRKMLGRMRSSPLEVVEMERHPTTSKIIKHDSLSIYEATLLKLKQGSHSSPSISQQDSPTMDEQCTMAIDTPEEAGMPSNAAEFSPNCSTTSQSACSSKQYESKNMSILSFFSKCKSSLNAQSPSDKELIVAFSSSPSSCFSISPTSSS